MKLMYGMALGLTHLGNGAVIISQPRQASGYNPLPTKKNLLWHPATALVNFIFDPMLVSVLVRFSFQHWVEEHGVPLDTEHLPTVQLGRILFKAIPILALSLKSFSVLMQHNTATPSQRLLALAQQALCGHEIVLPQAH